MPEQPTIPTPNYDYDVAILRGYYEQAMREISNELLRLSLTDFERAQTTATLAEIKQILKELDGNVAGWVGTNIPIAAADGVAYSLVALELADNIAEAKAIVAFNKLNRDLIKTAVADTQSDLLQVSQNVQRKVRLAIREATADAMRTKLTQGVNGTVSLKRAVLERMDAATKSGIIDASGRKWKPEVYTEMVVRTKMSTTHREATINDALSREAYYGVISKHGAKDACRNWEGRVIKLVREAPGDYPFIGDIPRRELFHPNCKHVISPIRKPERS